MATSREFEERSLAISVPCVGVRADSARWTESSSSCLAALMLPGHGAEGGTFSRGHMRVEAHSRADGGGECEVRGAYEELHEPATRGRGKGGCRGEEAGGRWQRAGGGACTWGGVLPWVLVWTDIAECSPSSVHFARRSSYYATATKPGPTCSKKGCLYWDGAGR